MFILSLIGHEAEGAYAVTDDEGEKALYLFTHEDDASRYAGLLDADEEEHVKLSVVEIDDEIAVETCNRNNYKYVVITPEDIVVPPQDYDHIQEDPMA
tara:strand:- start:1588 stop:1881 length:294 start_codon:yes stop_codon:yes gene_type:complete